MNNYCVVIIQRHDENLCWSCPLPNTFSALRWELPTELLTICKTVWAAHGQPIDRYHNEFLWIVGSSCPLSCPLPTFHFRMRQYTLPVTFTTTSDAFAMSTGDAVSRRQHYNSFHLIKWNSYNRQCLNNSKNTHFKLSFRYLLYSIHLSRTPALFQVNVHTLSLFVTTIRCSFYQTILISNRFGTSNRSCIYILNVCFVGCVLSEG